MTSSIVPFTECTQRGQSTSVRYKSFLVFTRGTTHGGTGRSGVYVMNLRHGEKSFERTRGGRSLLQGQFYMAFDLVKFYLFFLIWSQGLVARTVLDAKEHVQLD